MKRIERPNKEQVKRYLKKWDLLDNYVLQERSLSKLFQKTYSDNTVLEEVLIKV